MRGFVERLFLCAVFSIALVAGCIGFTVAGKFPISDGVCSFVGVCCALVTLLVEFMVVLQGGKRK